MSDWVNPDNTSYTTGFKFVINSWLAKITGKLMASIYNRLYTWNSYFRNKAHVNRAFNPPSFKSFFVYKQHVANDFVRFSFPESLVEVVDIDEVNRLMWKVWCDANEF